jgi:peptidoglycan hydrolase-like protein with peptidoglycan-binding domain
MELISARFSGVFQLKQCATDDNAHFVVNGSSGEGVALVQQALIDLGYDIEGGADGDYGRHTGDAVLRYRTDRNIRRGTSAITDVCGTGTIAALDEEIDAYDANPPDCFDTGDAIGFVDLGGVPAPALNALLALFGADNLVSIDDAGATADLTGGAVEGDTLFAVADSGAGLLAERSDVDTLAATLAAVAAHPAIAEFVDVVTALATPPLDLINVASIALLIAQLTAPSTAANLASIAARDLTFAQAIQEAVSAHIAGEIVITPDPVSQPPVAGKMISLSSNVIAGVIFMQVGNDYSRKAHYAPKNETPATLDPRHLVGLVRLARFLKTKGVTELHHVGVNGDASRLSGDCHQGGRALDLVGVRGADGATPFLLTVYDDWHAFTVPNPNNAAKRMTDWPHQTMKTEYRLATHPTVDAFTRAFWSDLYAFIATQYQDRSQSTGSTLPASSIGDPSSIMTPDHPKSDQSITKTETTVNGQTKITTKIANGSSGREAHAGHVHMQIGVTGIKIR